MKRKWIIGMDPFADEQGYIIHRNPPEFLAKWRIEDDDYATLSDLVFTDAAEIDAVAIYDFEWSDEMPSEELFRETCTDGIQAIDEYLHCVSGLKAEMKG
tara:strand:+ start:794 stop:1093 length:300 start_codon:yes stop_codon:yes gene_type:complete